MITLKETVRQLNQIAPLALAENWDNVGLLAGDHDMQIKRLMTCLTITDSVLDEAISKKINLIVVHHPIPFKPIHQITTNNTTGRILWKAISNSIAIYSPHTAWDNAPAGINRQIAHILQLGNLRCMQPSSNAELAAKEMGAGIVGDFATPIPIHELWRRLKTAIPEIQQRCTDSDDKAVSRVAIVCGSGGSMLHLAAKHRCDAFVTGEATYHQVIEAQATGLAMLLMGHFASERFAMRKLAALLADSLTTIECLASESETSEF